jgi:hypothetical protein
MKLPASAWLWFQVNPERTARNVAFGAQDERIVAAPRSLSIQLVRRPGPSATLARALVDGHSTMFSGLAKTFWLGFGRTVSRYQRYRDCRSPLAHRLTIAPAPLAVGLPSPKLVDSAPDVVG